MIKEIIVNAGELESRVAILENGRLMELHVERDPKIVGNIYKGRVTKVLKGMDAAFVDIGIERNAFLAVADVVPEDDDEEGTPSGRIGRRNLPPITDLLRANQEILAQVVRAPMGTKGARITTRLSLPGRYMVLMLNSGSYVGVSRKIEDPVERQRLRAIANAIRPESYSVIVRTEAENKSEEELRLDLNFLLDMARKIETKAQQSPAPSLVHGDLTLIFRLIRDAFTRDVNRVVVDSPSAYENVLELVGMIAPRMKNRVFLYNDPLPIFHAYNIEPEIERTLRRRVWLPSGGYLIIDQAEALTAIDVNTGRFVGSVELAETVLTTNLQAAEEVARQLRLRDLGGIIVVDFIDMDNVKHRQQVTKAFEEALRRDRAKIKMHNISSLGLVEMTRKRTGESLVGQLTEPCPFCSGIGRIQNSLTMALRVEREIVAMVVEAPNTEALLVTAHPRVVAGMLGFEGEAHADMEHYIERPVYYRTDKDIHPNTYRIDQLTLEQAIFAVKHFEEGQIVEGQVVNPDPELSLSPLVQAEGVFIIVPDLHAPIGAHIKVRITQTSSSIATAEPLAAELRAIRTDQRNIPISKPPMIPVEILPSYLLEERSQIPPRELPLLSPGAEAVPAPIIEEEISEIIATPEAPQEYRRNNRRRGKRGSAKPMMETAGTVIEPASIAEEVEMAAAGMAEAVSAEIAATPEAAESTGTSASARRRRRRRRGRGGSTIPTVEEAAETTLAEEGIPEERILTQEPEKVEAIEEVPAEAAGEKAPSRSRRRRRSSRRRENVAEVGLIEELVATPILEEVPPEVALEAMFSLLDAIPDLEAETPVAPEQVEETLPENLEEIAEAAPPEEAPAPAPRKRTRARKPRAPKTAEPTPEPVAEPVAEPEAEPVAQPEAEAVAEAPKRRRRARKTAPENTENA